MDRRRLLLSFLAGAIGGPRAARAQQTPKVPLVAALWASPAAVVTPYRAAFEAGLEDRGWKPGRNIRLEHRYPERPDAIPRLAAELVGLRPDVIVAATNPVIDRFRHLTASIPIVMLYANTPVEAGFIKTMARPGTNLTGLTFDPTPEVYAKNVELLTEAVPRARRIGVLWNPKFFEMAPGSMQYLDALRNAAQQRGLTLRFLAVTRLEEIETLFAKLGEEHLAAMLVVADPFVTFPHFRRIAELTATRLPAIFVFREHVDAGGLVSYGPNIVQMPRYVAGHVDKLLRGANVAELPVEQPTKYELVINLKTARGLGLTIPPSLLLRADQVIE